MHRESHTAATRPFFARVQSFYSAALQPLVRARWLVAACYLAATALVIVVLLPRIGTDIFPRAEAGQLQLRIRAPAGTLLDRTETYTQDILKLIGDEAGKDNLGASLALIGVHGSAYPINFIYLWNSGPQESVLQVELKDSAGKIDALKERLRQRIARDMRELQVSFEPADIVSRVMSFGASTPIEVAVSGPSLDDDKAFAERVRQKLSALPNLRDVQLAQPLDYPSVNVALDRERAGVLGITANDLTRALSPATSSSRFTQPLYWAAPNTGIAYQVQVEVPQQEMTSIEDVRGIPITADKGKSTLLSNDATDQAGTMVGEYDRYNMDRMVTVTANIENTDLGSAAKQVEAAIAQLGKPPARVSIASRGQVQPLTGLLSALQTGLLLATLVIFLLLAGNFQSVQLALIAILTAPAAIAGAALALWLWGSTLNLESFMGAIMAVGVAVANAILLVTFAERSRIAGKSSIDAAREGAESRLRPILMTSLAMIAGMLPMAIGFGSTGGQAAPLGQAVVGGLAAATVATLLVLPGAFALIRANAGRHSSSLDPDDPSSRFAKLS
jgi:multidrug efflux pump subunit AcrB